MQKHSRTTVRYVNRLRYAVFGRLQAFHLYGGKGVAASSLHKESIDSLIVEALDALAERTVIVTNVEQRVVWERYGLRLYIPSNALPDNCSQFELKMKVALAKEFQLPGGDGGPVSAVYSFCHDLGGKELCQPVTVEMQHCAAASAVKDLCIVRADESSNVFDIIPGGVFDQSDGYATIKLRSFCKLCVYLHWFLASLFSTLVPCAKLYYTNIECNSFRFYLYLIPWLDALLEVCVLSILSVYIFTKSTSYR